VLFPFSLTTIHVLQDLNQGNMEEEKSTQFCDCIFPELASDVLHDETLHCPEPCTPFYLQKPVQQYTKT